jgi:hypothetical protein
VLHTKRAKHIDTQWFFVRDRVVKDEIVVKYCASELMIADILTKPLPVVKHEAFTQQLGVICLS